MGVIIYLFHVSIDLLVHVGDMHVPRSIETGTRQEQELVDKIVQLLKITSNLLPSIDKVDRLLALDSWTVF